MTRPQETEMNANENIESNVLNDVTVLGVASVETLGAAGTGEEHGQSIGPGIEEN